MRRKKRKHSALAWIVEALGNSLRDLLLRIESRCVALAASGGDRGLAEGRRNYFDARGVRM